MRHVSGGLIRGWIWFRVGNIQVFHGFRSNINQSAVRSKCAYCTGTESLRLVVDGA